MTDELNEQHSPRFNKGQQLGSYVILDALGAGGMGEVYLAKDTRLDRTVALKVLSEDIASDERRMQRFRQEAKIASSLNQPNILTIFEFGEVDGLTFLATEYIDGETLRETTAREETQNRRDPRHYDPGAGRTRCRTRSTHHSPRYQT